MNNWTFIFQHLRLIIGGEGYQNNGLSLAKKWKLWLRGEDDYRALMSKQENIT